MVTYLHLLIFGAILIFIRATWVGVSVPDSSVSYVAATWLSSTTCIMVGNVFEYGIVLKSTDAGHSWTTKLTNVNRIFDVTSRTISSTLYLLAVTDSGDIYSSTDSGETWLQSINVAGSLYGASIGSNGNAFVVGMYLSSSTIYKASASSGYQTWTTSSITANKQLNGVCSLDGTNAVAVANGGGVYTTSSAGLGWNTRNSGTTADLYSIACPSTSRIYVAGTSSTVITSTNGGSTWLALTGFIGIGSITASDSFILHSLSAVSVSSLTLASTSGTIIKSTNSGSSWINDGTSTDSYYCVSMYDSNAGIVGATGIAGRKVPGMFFCLFCLWIVVLFKILFRMYNVFFVMSVLYGDVIDRSYPTAYFKTQQSTIFSSIWPTFLTTNSQTLNFSTYIISYRLYRLSNLDYSINRFSSQHFLRFCVVVCANCCHGWTAVFCRYCCEVYQHGSYMVINDI